MYHLTESKDKQFHAGDVVRLGESAFMDAVILGFDDNDNAKISRPYAYVSSVGTTGPTVLVGTETVVFSAKDLVAYPRVGGGRVT